jgi:PLD-like domain
VQVIPGGFVAATQAVREQIDGAPERLDLMNPYLTDRDMVDRIVAAARRGVKVRVVVSETGNNPPATAALEHHYGELIDAGAEIWEVPGTVVHAKVVVADDVVSFGTLNLDGWALYRDAEIAMVARSAEAATLFEERLFEPTSLGRSPASHAPAPANGWRVGSGTSSATSSEVLTTQRSAPSTSSRTSSWRSSRPSVRGLRFEQARGTASRSRCSCLTRTDNPVHVCDSRSLRLRSRSARQRSSWEPTTREDPDGRCND